MKRLRLVLACAHATNAIPPAYAKLFSSQGAKKLLKTHRGIDLGALDVARDLQKQLKVPLRVFPVTRLLVEPDGYTSSNAWSEFTMALSDPEKAKLLERYWHPFMDAIEKDIRKRTPALLVVSHSFTPVWKGKARTGDVGILFDPKRPQEKRSALALQKALRKRLPGMVIRQNYPYTGISEGVATYFRERFSGDKFIGLEIEVNNKHIRRKTKNGEAIKRALAASLAELAG